MTGMIQEFASRRLADALFMEDIGADVNSLLSATKLVCMELEEVSQLHALS